MKTLTQVSRRRTTVPIIKAGSSTATNHRPKITSILVPIDFSKPCLKALDYALQLANTFNAKLTLLHVIEVPPVPEFATYPTTPNSDDRMDKVKKQLMTLAGKHGCGAGVLEAVRVRTGPPFREITRAAESLKADAIVIATHGYTGLAHVLLGSTAERVVRYAPCPVLVVPARK